MEGRTHFCYNNWEELPPVLIFKIRFIKLMKYFKLDVKVQVFTGW